MRHKASRRAYATTDRVMGDHEFEVMIPGIKTPIPLDACDICDTWYSLNQVSIVTCPKCARAQIVCKRCTHCANEDGEFMCVACMLTHFGETDLLHTHGTESA